MASTRLIQLIENNAGQIVGLLLQEVRSDSRLTEFGRLPDSELLRRFNDVCEKLGHWMTAKDEHLLEQQYGDLGRERFEEGIPLHEVVLATQLFKRGMLRFARRQAIDHTSYEILAEEELQHQVGDFFDRLVYYLTRGYVRALQDSVHQPPGQGRMRAAQSSTGM